MKKITAFFLLVCSITNVSAHTFYEALSSISFNSHSGNLEIVHHFTSHDLTLMLTENSQTKVSEEKPNFEVLVKQYFADNFMISKNNQKVELNWIGLDAGINETVIYQEIPDMNSVANLTITNNLLIDFYPHQLNRLNYQDGTHQGTLIFKEGDIVKKILGE